MIRQETLAFPRLRLRLRKSQSPGTTFLFWTLVLAFYYDWYCYPFKMGSTATSPTYNDTPAWISAIKYVLFFALCVGLLPGAIRVARQLRVRRPLYLVAYLSLLLLPLFYGGAGEIYRIFQVEPFFSQRHIPLERVFEVGIFFVAAILLHAQPPQRINFRPIINLMTVTLAIYLAFDLLEIAAFFLFGRLPAEAYENSILVRFGSLMDKPNYFGILTALFFGLIFASEWRYRNKVLIFVLLSAALLLTLSFTACAAVGVVCVIYSLATLRRLTYRVVFTAVLGLVVLAVAVRLASNSDSVDWLDTYQQMIEAKSSSVEVHLQSLDIVRKHFGIANLIGLEPVYEGVSAETQYVEIAVTEGGLYLFLFTVVMATALYRCMRALARKRTSPEVRVMASAAFCLLLAMVVAGFGLPVMAMFPLNLLTALMLGICSSGMLEEPPFRRIPSSDAQTWFPKSDD